MGMVPTEVVHRLRGDNEGALVGRGCCQSPSELDRGREGRFETSVFRLACLDFLDEEEEKTLKMEEEEPCPASDALPLTAALTTLRIFGGSGERLCAEYG